ncbi:CPBP family intramembrane glutamic endopeptidase [Flavobacterium foetidum]|uniref:CPBP family intramembrane glutamic endopeptidase n=1 Tax=Flavobacterium foetidum TaxID=2026681 RepID=UPI0010754AAB|nr:type II CAAX endopeptidase family protein [Flavobacterium foetidum]KAF2517109.1 CPBP family intramembrane metalloprotease [Flavobacterium foetidum]
MNKLKFPLLFIFGFAIYFLIDATTFSFLQKEITVASHSKILGHVLAYTITLIPLIITVMFLHKSTGSVTEKLGLSKGLFIGVIFAFVSTLPMLIAYLVNFSLNTKLSLDTILINTISSAIFEEIIYRAFLFGMLYRFTRLGFMPSIFLGSLLFGIAHLYQSTDLNELIGIFLITFLGSVIFAWIYAEWNFNLWTAVFLHCLMNLYWLLFDVSSNSLGDTCANIFRFSTLFIAISITIYYKRKNKIALEINKKTWWMKRKAIIRHKQKACKD